MNRVLQIAANPLVNAIQPSESIFSATSINADEKQYPEKFTAIKPISTAKNSPSRPGAAVSSGPAVVNETARTLFYVQQAASEISAPEPQEKTAVDEFLEYMDKSSADIWRERILRSMGLTEESLAALSPEKRRAVEEKIVQIIRDEIEKSAKEAAKKSELKNLEKETSSSVQKLDPKIVQMAELPAETYHAYAESMEELEEETKRQDKNAES